MASDAFDPKDAALFFVAVHLDVLYDGSSSDDLTYSRYRDHRYKHSVKLLCDLGFRVDLGEDGKHTVSKGWWS